MSNNLQPETKWQKPPQDKIKLNWDADLDQRKCQIGMGAIIKNNEGMVLGTM